MSSDETGQMSAVETGQMSAVETGQMSAVVDLRQDKCHLLQEQTSGSMLMSQKSQLWQYHNVQVSEKRSGPKSANMARNGSRMVART